MLSPSIVSPSVLRPSSPNLNQRLALCERARKRREDCC